MIGAKEIEAILEQYAKHGWILRRVLLSAQTAETPADLLKTLFGEAEIFPSDIDAAWFARAAPGDREAWELRYFGKTPFALVEVFDAEDEEEVREQTRSEMESRIRELSEKFGGKK